MQKQIYGPTKNQTRKLLFKKKKIRQKKALPNRTASAIHVDVPSFPDSRGLLASDLHVHDWVDHALLPGSCACVKLCVRIGYIQYSVFCLKFISLNNRLPDRNN